MRVQDPFVPYSQIGDSKSSEDLVEKDQDGNAYQSFKRENERAKEEAIYEKEAYRMPIPGSLRFSLQGMGPGLRVVLRDGTGAFVRNESGEEYMALRQWLEKARESKSE